MTQSYAAKSEQAISGRASVPEAAEPLRKTVNWPHVWAYVGLSFGLSWLIDLVIYLNGGLAGSNTKLLMQFMMLMPAFTAMLLGMFFFKESPIFYKTNRTASRWFIYYYFFMTFAYLVVAVLGLVRPAQALTFGSYLGLINLAGIVLLVLLRWRGGPAALPGAGGNWRIWLLYGLGIVLFCGIEALLNYVFKLGQPGDPAVLYPPGSMAAMPPMVLLVSTGFNMIVSARCWD